MSRSVLAGLILLSAGFASSSDAAVLLSWTFNAVAAENQAVSLPSTYSASGIQASTVNKAAGLNAAGGGGYNGAVAGFNSTGAGATTIAAAVSGNDFYYFNIATSAEGTMSLSQLRLGFYQQNGTGIVAELQYSTDGTNFTAIPVTPAFSTIASAGTTGPGTLLSADLSTISSLQSYKGTAYFRLPIAHADNYVSQGLGRVDIDGAGSDIQFDGAVVIPEPAAIATLGISALALIRRRRTA